MVHYIKEFLNKKVGTFYFGHLIFGSFHLISDKNFGHFAEKLLKKIYAYIIGIRVKQDL